MGHPFPVREIARQAGLSEATVDRVLNDRAGVRPSTASQVRQAISDLERQHTQLRLGGRQFIIDVVMDTPKRFSAAVRSAIEAELPAMAPAVIRARFHFREQWPIDELLQDLRKIERRGSQGVILKAPDDPEVVQAIARLRRANIPVVTLVTDVSASERLAYVGMDNRAAGVTSAYLMTQWLGSSDGDILAIVSRNFFRGEEEREMGFRSAMQKLDPARKVDYLSNSDGLDDATQGLVAAALNANPGIRAVYSIGGGNEGAVSAFEQAGRECAVFIGHDLVASNVALLSQGRISALLHHDLREDARRCCRLFMQYHGALPGSGGPGPSKIDIITPYNIPSEKGFI